MADLSPIVLIHGAWVTPRCWDGFATRYREAGHEVLAPAWPHLGGTVEDLRARPPAPLGSLGFAEIVESYARVVRELPVAPILIGHSFGGLVVLHLLAQGLGVAGVAIDPAPPRGVLPSLQAVLSSAPALAGLRVGSKVVTMSRKSFERDFAQGLPPAERKAAYDTHIVPSSGRLFVQAATFHADLSVDFEWAERAPLLLIAGAADRIVTPSMVRATRGKYDGTATVTDLREFPRRSHFLIAEPGWQEVADAARTWAIEHQRA